jgi:hypothetical protein
MWILYSRARMNHLSNVVGGIANSLGPIDFGSCGPYGPWFFFSARLNDALNPFMMEWDSCVDCKAGTCLPDNDTCWFDRTARLGPRSRRSGFCVSAIVIITSCHQGINTSMLFTTTFRFRSLTNRNNASFTRSCTAWLTSAQGKTGAWRCLL